ncbi:quinolinate synthase NadA [Ferroglobus sp.]|uniref:quinolinate synthase NadA n=1 Tax=Ferroglobus sp. TaxID=2614230 RepID=UPI00345C0E5D
MVREKIERLKKEKNAIILAHNYQLPEVQDVADFVGDSLELSRKAVESDAEIIVFCGVDFMAETAKILNPDKKVLHPVPDAQCPMAHMLLPEMIEEEKRKHPEAKVVLYINTTAECKAYADIICTSANAVKVVESVDSNVVIFGPDTNLAEYVQSRVPEKKIIPVPNFGKCVVHVLFTKEDVEKWRRKFPQAKIVAHPECRKEVWSLADLVASTGGMVKNACKHDIWVVFTEREMCYRLKKVYPKKEFYPAREDAVCLNMKKITLKDVYHSLAEEKHEVNVPENVAAKAKKAIERMLEIA